MFKQNLSYGNCLQCDFFFSYSSESLLLKTSSLLEIVVAQILKDGYLGGYNFIFSNNVTCELIEKSYFC